MSTGSDLETAILAAARVYQQQDRAELQKQRTPRLHSGTYCAKSPVDFKGWYGPGRQPIYIEAKATSDGKVSFSDIGDGIREKQLEAMRDAAWRSIRMLLVVDFVPLGEVYCIDTREVVRFADAPWRKSLSLHWCRAFGELAKVETFNTPGMRARKKRVWLLDTQPHEGREAAYRPVVADKQRTNGAVVDLFPVEIAPSRKRAQRFAQRPQPGTEEHKEYVRALADEGLRRQMGARPKAFGQRRKGWAK